MPSVLHGRYPGRKKRQSEPPVWTRFIFTRRGQTIATDEALADGRTRDAWDWAFDADREAAARDALEFGRKTGYEKCVVLDYRTAERFAETTDNRKEGVNATAALARAAREGRTVVAVHNHSDGTPPSPQDVAVTVSWPGTLRETLVVTPEGRHTLRPGPLAPADKPDWALAYTMRMMQAEADAGLLSPEQWELELKGFAVQGSIYHDYRRSGS